MDTRIHIFTGHFGSGKTEVAVNFAKKLIKKSKKVCIVDLDIVNPYYRTKDAQKMLTDMGIRVITPEFANTNVDMPTLPSSILSVFTDKEEIVVFDVGGDDDGAIALGRYFGYFSKEPYKMYAVINSKRPLTTTSDEAIEMIYSIEQASRLKVNALINNTNLSYLTDVQVVLDGQKMVEEVSEKTGIEIEMISVKDDLIDKLPKEIMDKVFALDLFLQPKW